MTKKGEIITILAGLLFVYITDSAKAVINDVQITPDEPATEDIITVVTFGTETRGAVTVIDSVVNITDTNIGLDLTLKVGFAYIITPWSYSEDIGILPAGTYDLIVRIIVDSEVKDSYFTTFQVVPMTLDGSGTEQDPWRIRSLEDFNDFAADPNYWAGFTRLETDVNLAGRVYTTAVIAPDVNSSQDYFQGTAFTGVFDGNDHEVLNLTIDDGGGINKYSFLGLFGYVANGEVRNLGLEEGSVSGSGPAGGLVGQNVKGVVYNCYSNYDVNGVWFLGGLVGINEGNISHCYSTGIVNGNYYIGCLVGANLDVISSCYSTGDVNGMESVGGLVGINLIFENWPSISDCKSTSNVNGTRLVGGLVGENRMSSIENCSSAGSVRGDNQVGGLVGHNWDGIVSDCYSTSDVSGDNIVGGLVGSISGSYNNVFNCYSTGDVNGLGDVGGLVGTNWDVVSNCFWDTDKQTHGVTESIGDNQGTATNVLGLPTSQLHQQSTFTDWDFINVWNIGENQTYPYLRVYLPSDINKDGIVNFLDLSITANKWLEGDKEDE